MSDESDDLSLSRGQLGQGGVVDAGCAGTIDEACHEAARESGGQQGFATGDDPYPVQELAGFGVLDQEAGGPDPEGLGVGLACEFDRGGTVPHFADHGHSGLSIDQHSKASADQRLVVGDQHPEESTACANAPARSPAH